MADANRDHFTDFDEEFFRAGATTVEPQEVETFADLEDGHRPRSLWRRLFARKPPQE